jgi:hypothetical protein
MSTIKKMMMKGMNKIMLTCDQATLLATQNSIYKISCISKLQLRMHMAGCKFCRTYAKQTELISDQLQKEKEINPDELKLRLTVVQKDKLQTTIKENAEQNI